MFCPHHHESHPAQRSSRAPILCRAGRRHLRSHVPPAPSDVACICYTSGTTGVPKGAVLTHANFIANSAGMAAFVPVGPGEHTCSPLHRPASAAETHVIWLVLCLNCAQHCAQAIGTFHTCHLHTSTSA